MMNRTVNQIWLGGEMPAREKAWCDGVRAAAEAAGWQYRLWRDADIEAAYGTEPVAEVFRAARKALPGPVTYTLESDYYRLRVLADAGGLYMDTDFECSSWPEWPDEGDVWTAAERFNSSLLCNCLLWVLNPEAARFAAGMAAAKLTGALDPASPRFEADYIALVRRDKGGLVAGLGPRWLRNTVRPAAESVGHRWGIVGTDVAGHIIWPEHGPLCHHGVSWWHEGKRSEQAALWDARAKAAARKARPAYLVPQGKAVMSGSRPASSGTASVEPPFSLPGGVRRIVVLSNVTRDFSPADVPLRDGDLCIHLNHARHKAAAMAVPGVQHVLLVRHGRGSDPLGWHWYGPENYNGFCRVQFVEDARLCRPWSWWREFKARGGKSPTTGFIAANICRACWPEIPLLLAGFDPGVNHGTPCWEGHSWDVERAWYKEHNFRLLPPASARVLVMVQSCQGYLDREVRRRDADGCALSRRAARLTWWKELPANVEAFFAVGHGPACNEAGVVQLDAPDDYEHLPAKTIAGIRWALANREWDYLVKVDDDTYVHGARLAQYCNKLPRGMADIHGGASQPRDFNLCGGAGYILSRAMAEKVAADEAIPAEGLEDREVCASVLRHGGRVVKSPLFRMDATQVPSLGNNLVTAHHLNARGLYRVHNGTLTKPKNNG